MASVNKPLMHRKLDQRHTDLDSNIGYEYRRHVGQFVKHHRLANNMTQQQLADHLGFRNTHISAIEVGSHSLSPEHYESIAKLFGIPKQEMGEFMLRYTNPFIYALLFGKKKNDLKEDLGRLALAHRNLKGSISDPS